MASSAEESRPSIERAVKNEEEILTPNNEEKDVSVRTEENLANYPHGIRLAILVVAILLSMFLVALDMTIVATAIPHITDEFHSLEDVGWYGSAFFLTLASFQSFWGKLYKYYTLKLIFVFSVALFEIGSLLCGLAKDSVNLIVGRAITGWGAAGVISGCYIITAFIAEPKKRPAYTGLIGVVFACASVAGPLLGGVFTDTISWRWCFYINLPIGGLSLAIIVIFFQNPSDAIPPTTTLREKILQLDLPGTAVILAAFVCYLLDMQWGGTSKPWSAADVIGTLIGFALLIGLFIVIEIWQGERALLVPRILCRRVVFTSCAFVFFQSGANFLFTYYIPVYFQAMDGTSAEESGIRNLPMIAGAAIFAGICGSLVIYVGYFTPFLALGSGFTTIAAGLIYSLGIGTSSGKYIGYQLLLGIGQGLCIQVPIIVTHSFSEPTDISTVTSIVLFFQMMGGALAISAAQCVFGNRLLFALPSTAPGVNALSVLQIGATELRSVFAAEVLPGILDAYLKGLKAAFALGVGFSGIGFLASFTPPLTRLGSQAAAEISA